MKNFRILLIAAFAILLALYVWAPHVWAAPPDIFESGGGGVVATVIDGDTVRLKGAAIDIRLVGMQAPKLPLGRAGFKTWPLAEESKQALISLAQDRTVTLRLGVNPRDRNGRTLAHLVRDDGLWIQGEMLRLGFARVYSFPDNRKLTAEMLALESQARLAKRGMWANSFYAARDALSSALSDDVGTFQIVVGLVKNTAKTKDRIYLNFGDDYRNDFTIAVEKPNWPLFKTSKVDLVALKGSRIEVRGWLVARNGPMIEATHPEQIILLAK